MDPSIANFETPPVLTWDQMQHALANLWKGAYRDPAPPPAPAAPDTSSRAAMITWTPDQLEAADRARWAAWARNPYPDPPYALGDDWRTYVALALGLLALYVTGKLAIKVLL